MACPTARPRRKGKYAKNNQELKTVAVEAWQSITVTAVSLWALDTDVTPLTGTKRAFPCRDSALVGGARVKAHAAADNCQSVWDKDRLRTLLRWWIVNVSHTHVCVSSLFKL